MAKVASYLDMKVLTFAKDKNMTIANLSYHHNWQSLFKEVGWCGKEAHHCHDKSSVQAQDVL